MGVHPFVGRPLQLPSTASEPARWRLFWRNARSFWKPGGSSCAWPLAFALAAVVLGSLAVTYGINLWNRRFFDALEMRNGAALSQEALVFPLLVAGYLLICASGMWARMTMQRSWRAWINDRLLDRWLSNGRYYQLECIDGDHKNPEHRINDDLRIATEMPVDFVTGFATAALSAVTFFAVLWTQAGAITISLGSHSIQIEGYMVLAALAYAAIANGCMFLIARHLIPLTAVKNQAEAEYRYALTRVRENAESIALLRGDKAERADAARWFAGVIGSWRALVGQHMRAVIVSQGHAQLCGIVPVLLCIPRYIDGSMTLGQIMQIASAFSIVQGALNWLVDNFTRIAEWKASVHRVAALMSSLDQMDKEEASQTDRIRNVPSLRPGEMKIENLSVALPSGKPLVHSIKLRVRHRERVLLVGDSGTGKSAFVRALGGSWPWGSGQIKRSAGSDLGVVPQRPYLPAGTLKQAVCYPLEHTAFSRDDVAAALGAVGMGHFIRELDCQRSWSATLSQGERQRIAFARLLLLRPALIILDEATSALHVKAQADLMRLIDEQLPEATIISIGHRPELEKFHQRKLTMQACPGGARIVADEVIGPSHQATASGLGEMTNMQAP
jgi:putative ATP-binding cassette transporter